MQIVLIATRWGTAEGGINAFNKPFAEALALVGRGRIQVACAVDRASDAEVAEARARGVTLISVQGAALQHEATAGRRAVTALHAEGGDGTVDLWVGHDVKTGFAASAAAAEFAGRAALVHHMDYESYRNLWGGRGQDTAAKTDEQMRLLSTPDAILFGVGDDLRASAARLGGREAHRIVPGFPDGESTNLAGSDHLRVIVAGRFDADSELLKQSRLVAAGLGRAVRRGRADHPALRRATLTIFGATDETIAQAKLEQLAHDEAGWIFSVVPTGFDAERGILRHLRRSNLAVMPSVREGFGLFGWEAIGCGVPLILGEQTGLASLLDRELDDHADRHVTKLDLTGKELDERDINATAEAIISVARDLEYAREKAERLRNLLKDTLGGCTWSAAAEAFLDDCGVRGPPPVGTGIPTAAARGLLPAPAVDLRAVVTNHRERCAELELEDQLGQGSTHARFDLFATLRFGRTPLVVDDVEVSVGIRRAALRVTTRHGRLAGDRVGGDARPASGIVAAAGGVWDITDPGGGLLKGKVLGTEPLCRIETPANLPAHAKVEVTADRTDIVADFQTRRPLARATESVMKVFLENALFEAGSGHMILSSGELSDRNDA